eukprot:scaffold8028_cov165-Amphora_coffeaeformis.AAC.10
MTKESIYWTLSETYLPHSAFASFLHCVVLQRFHANGGPTKVQISVYRTSDKTRIHDFRQATRKIRSEPDFFSTYQIGKIGYTSHSFQYEKAGKISLCPTDWINEAKNDVTVRCTR